ncbi:hypothetical protein [Siansivirga zeaxanthinifaciens]|uniref:Uncharacterized protein n=1 Tax=Siansivirga zeaxanthinifaciens CC-SAMT-1 TaxID=1454006 RepID=A0A0C5W8R6_9FLAO|nr:hypothetical protein [Siansivirga zeaxanthinifaciens]AJR03568.1 hypothetical protein AW14_07950 [Siansivirga zeaxanthinifaciens CC-SAMT-1]
MKKSIRYTQKQNDVIELISHLILTKPSVVESLLSKHGVDFGFQPSKENLINEVVEKLKTKNLLFNKDLEGLLDVHVKNKGQELIALKSQEYFDNQVEDQFLGGIVGGLAKGAISGISGLFGKKKKSSGGSSNAAAQQQAAMAAKLKADMDAKMRRLEDERRRAREEADRRRREEEDRRRREREEDERRRRQEEEDRRRRESENANKEKSSKNMLMIGGVAAVLLVGGVLVVAMKK